MHMSPELDYVGNSPTCSHSLPFISSSSISNNSVTLQLHSCRADTPLAASAAVINEEGDNRVGGAAKESARDKAVQRHGTSSYTGIDLSLSLPLTNGQRDKADFVKVLSFIRTCAPSANLYHLKIKRISVLWFTKNFIVDWLVEFCKNMQNAK